MRRQRKGVGEKLTQERRNELLEAGVTIWGGFDWSASRAGYKFWAKVCRELQRIAETGEP